MAQFKTSGTTGNSKTFTVSDELMQARIDRTLISNGPDFAGVKSIYCDFAESSHSATRFKAYAEKNGIAFYGPLATMQLTLAQFKDKAIDCITGSPQALLRFVRAGLRQPFKCLMCSTSQLTAEASQEIRSALGDNLWTGYGNSEAGGRIAGGFAVDTAEKILGCVGKPIADVQVRIVEGEIQVKVPGMITAYDDPAQTAAKFVDGWFKTGDLGSLTPDGMVVISGRKE